MVRVPKPQRQVMAGGLDASGKGKGCAAGSIQRHAPLLPWPDHSPTRHSGLIKGWGQAAYPQAVLAAQRLWLHEVD